jgi:ABC-type molybdate transport system substrate-binding protein
VRDRRTLALALFGVIAMSEAAPADTVQLYAAGSLRAALTEVGRSFESETAIAVKAKFGPSGILKDEIFNGAKADVFASANLEHPRALSAANKSGPVRLFARNRLCALVRTELKVDSESLLERMLDPSVKLATSTPKADPSGDYAFEVFRKADTVKPGSRAVLEAKALQLTGSPSSAQPPAGRAVYGWHIAEGRADIFLAYCTAMREALRQNPGQQSVALPDALAVGADYGLTVISGADLPAQKFADYIMSLEGQKILISHGFAPGQN